MEWLAYYQLEPWGEARADLRAGIIANTVYGCHRSRKDPPRRPTDFMPKFRHVSARQQSAEEMQHRLKAALGSKRFKERER